MISNKNEKIISDIIDFEWEMFSSVKPSEANDCQEKEKTFRLMRWMSYSVFDEKVLESILLNLKNALSEGRNLMVEKYARMEGKIPAINLDPLIAQNATYEVEGMKEVSQKYPLTFPKQSDQFEKYALCEMETYSADTLKLYNEMLIDFKKNDINIVEERYNNLFKKMGYESVADKESQEKAKKFWDNNECRGC